jgi:hypothetical protein
MRIVDLLACQRQKVIVAIEKQSKAENHGD